MVPLVPLLLVGYAYGSKIPIAIWGGKLASFISVVPYAHSELFYSRLHCRPNHKPRHHISPIVHFG